VRLFLVGRLRSHNCPKIHRLRLSSLVPTPPISTYADDTAISRAPPDRLRLLRAFGAEGSMQTELTLILQEQEEEELLGKDPGYDQVYGVVEQSVTAGIGDHISGFKKFLMM
jgi:hypothetical protein